MNPVEVVPLRFLWVLFVLEENAAEVKDSGLFFYEDFSLNCQTLEPRIPWVVSTRQVLVQSNLDSGKSFDKVHCDSFGFIFIFVQKQELEEFFSVFNLPKVVVFAFLYDFAHDFIGGGIDFLEMAEVNMVFDEFRGGVQFGEFRVSLNLLVHEFDQIVVRSSVLFRSSLVKSEIRLN